MADQVEIPQLATELFEMSKGYLDQEVRAPLKRTGAYMKFSLIGGALFSLGMAVLECRRASFPSGRAPGIRSLQRIGLRHRSRRVHWNGGLADVASKQNGRD
jgi:hypothetical protein